MPQANAREVVAGGGIGVYGVRFLKEAAEFLADGSGVGPSEPWSENGTGAEDAAEDFADVAGQGYAKRASRLRLRVGTS